MESRGAGYAPNVSRSAPVAFAPDVAAVKQLMNELLAATPSSMTQTALRLSDPLKALRDKVGGGVLKNDLTKLIQALDVYLASQAAVLQSIKQLFPDTGGALQPGSTREGGHQHVFNRPALRSPESISNRPPAERVNPFDYYTDTSKPGRRPSVGNEPGNIWSGFRQGKDGNCITVAAIKAAMMRFGQKPTDIFSHVKLAGDGYNVEMRDGFKLHLSKNELAQAAKRSDFKGDGSAMLADATFLYAVSAKRAQIENNDGYASKSYGHALTSINDSDNYRGDGLLRLGLRNHIRETSVSNLARGQLGVVTRGVNIDGKMTGHSLAVINGREEMWGKQGSHPPTNVYANALALV